MSRGGYHTPGWEEKTKGIEVKRCMLNPIGLTVDALGYLGKAWNVKFYKMKDKFCITKPNIMIFNCGLEV